MLTEHRACRRCNCPRCHVEAGLPEELSTRLQQLYESHAASWMPAFTAAVDDGDGDSLEALQGEILEQLGEVEEGLDQLVDLTNQQRLWVRAGVYCCYELVSQVEELLQPEGGEASHLKACLDLIQVRRSLASAAAASCLGSRVQILAMITRCPTITRRSQFPHVSSKLACNC